MHELEIQYVQRNKTTVVLSSVEAASSGSGMIRELERSLYIQQLIQYKKRSTALFWCYIV